MLAPTGRNSGAAQLTLRLLRLNESTRAQALRQLATGRRINRGADDPAAIVTSARLSASIAALEAESRSNARAQAVVATADAALGEASALLGEARRLALANADSTLSPEERAANQAQIDAIAAGIDRIGNTAQFNGVKLFDGNLSVSVTGASVSVDRLSSAFLGATDVDGQAENLASLRTGGRLASGSGRDSAAAEVVDRAIGDIATARARLGAFARNTLETRAGVLGVAVENLSAARAAVEDADLARVTAEAFRGELLAAASTVSLARSFRSRRQAFAALFAP